MVDELSLPSDQALLAATLALMTAFANPDPDARIGQAAQRRLIARKIVSNLFFLRAHPAVAAPLRQVVDTMHTHWRVVVGRLEGDEGLARLEAAEPPCARPATWH